MLNWASDFENMMFCLEIRVFCLEINRLHNERDQDDANGIHLYIVLPDKPPEDTVFLLKMY